MRFILLLILVFIFTITTQGQNFQWKELETPVKASLRGLSPVSDKICWASGSGGTWLKTKDGGASWEYGVIAGLDTVDFRSIHAFDAHTAIVASAGQPALIFRTVNGGKSWDKVHHEGEEAFFDGITFLDEKRGFVIGDPVAGLWMILETQDGGKSWKGMEHLPRATAGEAAFAASASSMIVTESNLIFGTGGSESNLHFYDLDNRLWKKVNTPMLQGEASQGIFALVKAKDAIVGVGGDYTQLDLRTRNSFSFEGDTFSTPSVLPFGYRSGVAYLLDRRQMIAVGPSGSDFSLDEGNTWENFSAIGYHAVKISLNQKSIWASGSSGRIGFLIEQ